MKIAGFRRLKRELQSWKGGQMTQKSGNRPRMGNYGPGFGWFWRS